MGGGSRSQTVGYKYFLGMHMVLCHGPVDAVGPIYVGERRLTGQFNSAGGDNAVTSVGVSAESLFGGPEKEGGISGSFQILFGGSALSQNFYLQSQLGTNIPAYRGIVSVVLNQMYIAAGNPYPKAWSFTVKSIPGKDWYSSKAAISVRDGSGNIVGEETSANGAHIIREGMETVNEAPSFNTFTTIFKLLQMLHFK